MSEEHTFHFVNDIDFSNFIGGQFEFKDIKAVHHVRFAPTDNKISPHHLPKSITTNYENGRIRFNDWVQSLFMVEAMGLDR